MLILFKISMDQLAGSKKLNNTLANPLNKAIVFLFLFNPFLSQQVWVGGRNKNKNKFNSDHKIEGNTIACSFLIQLKNGSNEFNL